MIEAATATEIGRLLGVTARRIHQLAAEGTLPKPAARGAFQVADCVKAFVAYVSGREEPARARLARLRADLMELELRRKAGELVEVKAVRAALSAKARQVRTSLEGLTSRLAGELAAESDQVAAGQVLRREFDRVLEELAQPLEV